MNETVWFSELWTNRLKLVVSCHETDFDDKDLQRSTVHIHILRKNILKILSSKHPSG